MSAGLGGLALASGLATGLLANLVVQSGSAGANTAGFAIAAAWFPNARRGLASGIVMGGAGAGIAAAGGLLPAVLASGASGWRVAWGLVAAASLLIAAACGLLLRDPPRGGARADALPVGAVTPVTGVFRQKELWMVAGLVALFGFQYIIFGTFFAARLTEAGWSIQGAGRLWSVVGVLSIGSGLVGGALSDRIGRLPALATLFSIQAAASLLLGASAHGLGLYGSVLLYGGSVMGFPAIVGAFCGDAVGPARASAAVGFVNIFFATGQMLGPVAAGMVIDRTGLPGAALLVGAAVGLAGAAGSLAAGRYVAPPPR